MIRLLQDHTDMPLCIDSSVIEALEAGLDAYEGKALVNSVTGEDDRLELILPIVAKHGAAVIGLTNDETGIPETAEKRLEIARKIVSVAGDHGIPPEDVVIDPLAMTVGADPQAVRITLDAIEMIRDELGVNMCLGASNVSFGLPERHTLNAAFLAMGSAHGLTSAIMNALSEECVRSVRAQRSHARQGRVGRELDLGTPRAPGGRALVSVASQEAMTGEGVGRVRLRFLPDGPEVRVPPGRQPVRRRELERRRDRLDLRRLRHVQEVQGAHRRGRAAGQLGRPARLHARRAARRLAAGVPRAGQRATS